MYCTGMVTLAPHSVRGIGHKEREKEREREREGTERGGEWGEERERAAAIRTDTGRGEGGGGHLSHAPFRHPWTARVPEDHAQCCEARTSVTRDLV